MALIRPDYGKGGRGTLFAKNRIGPPGIYLKFGLADSVLNTSADTLLVAGIILNVGSCMQDKHMVSMKLKDIYVQAAALAAQNMKALKHNEDINSQLSQIHA